MRAASLCLSAYFHETMRWTGPVRATTPRQGRGNRAHDDRGEEGTVMKKLFKEFATFINRGNVMDMAVGVIIGAAFTAIVTSLTDDIINPLISMIGGSPEVQGMSVTFNGATVDFGAFISAIINFLIVALCVFLIVKAFNQAQTAGAKLVRHGKDEVVVPPTCPYCLEEVHVGATRCGHCGSELPEKAQARVEKAGE